MEEKFVAAWASAREKAAALGVKMRPVPAEEAMKAAHRCLSGRRLSDGFNALKDKGRLELALEALAIDELTPHQHLGTDKPEGIKSHLSKTIMLALAVTIHNLPEGMAVGVVFAGAENSSAHISLAGAVSMAIGIAIQNIPEGAIISMPMRAAGNSRWKSFMLGSLSGVVEPVGAVAVLLLASLIMPALPYMLAFAAGAMVYVVVEELIPEASHGEHSNRSTIGFAIGFVLMMVLDVVMG